MSGAISPLSQYAYMAWCSVKAQGQLYFTFTFPILSLWSLIWACCLSWHACFNFKIMNVFLYIINYRSSKSEFNFVRDVWLDFDVLALINDSLSQRNILQAQLGRLCRPDFPVQVPMATASWRLAWQNWRRFRKFEAQTRAVQNVISLHTDFNLTVVT
jgi:hypothetical protein